MAATFVPNRAGIGDLLTRDETVAILLAKGEEVAQTARSRAPVDSGDYRDSIVVEDVPDRTRRAAVDVKATVRYALVVESRTRTLGSSV